MNPLIVRNNRNGPEDQIQKDIINFLRVRGWFVKSTHGNMYQSGFPDLFACHSRYGQRWIEVKHPSKYRFTAAQLEDFPKFCANGSGVWVLTADTETEYKKLFGPANWMMYLSIMK